MAANSSIPFFRALNPMSSLSGVRCQLGGISVADAELFDATFMEYIQSSWADPDITTFQSVETLANIIMGKHYTQPKRSMEICNNKGLMDFLILPLLARKLIFYSLGEKNCAKVAALVVGVILEVPRLAIGFTLTLLLAPVAMLLNALKPCLQSKFACLKPDFLDEDSPRFSQNSR